MKPFTSDLAYNIINSLKFLEPLWAYAPKVLAFSINFSSSITSILAKAAARDRVTTDSKQVGRCFPGLHKFFLATKADRGIPAAIALAK